MAKITLDHMLGRRDERLPRHLAGGERGLPHGARSLLHLDQDALGFLQHDQARPCQRDLPRGAGQEIDAELVLERADLAGKCRGSHAEPLGRSAEMQLFCHRDETSQLPHIHGRPLFPVSLAAISQSVGRGQ